MHNNAIDGKRIALPSRSPRSELKDKRKRLFKKSRPFIRPFSLEDMGWLWAAYRQGSFKIPEGLSQKEFSDAIVKTLGHFENFIVDDDHAKFKSKRGPVALITVSSDGWRYEPAIAFFKWASPRNKLRCAVSFFHKSTLSSKVGVCVVRWGKSNLLEHMKHYGVLFPRGKIPMGNQYGDEYIYSVLGRKGSETLNSGNKAWVKQ